MSERGRIEARTRTRTRQTVPYRLFEDAVEKMKMTPPKLCEAIGYSDSAYRTWRESGEVPVTAALAAECLLRRNSIKSRTTVVLRAPRCEVLAGGEHVTMAGEDVVVVEV